MVEYPRLAEGVNVAVCNEENTVPVTSPLNVKDDVLIVAASILSLNVAMILLSIDTSVAPSTGLVLVTVGAVVSRITESLAAPDTLPASSLYQANSTLLPSPPFREYETSLLKLFVASTGTQPTADGEGAEKLAERK